MKKIPTSDVEAVVKNRLVKKYKHDNQTTTTMLLNIILCSIYFMFTYDMCHVLTILLGGRTYAIRMLYIIILL